MLKRVFILAFVLSGIYVSLSAQILPPILNCVTNDTIHFTPVSNSCGNFISYEIFTSPNENGPFTLLGSVTDPSITFFEHLNSAGQTNFYFLTPLFDCPGEVSMNSDTISNRPPDVGILHTVSVENNFITLMWEASTSPEVIDYSVFLFTDTGLDFIANTPDLTFVDMARDPNLASLSYLIVANDGCGNRSIFGDPINSVFLNIAESPCEQEILFSWDRHANVVGQELWAITNNGNEVLIEGIDVQAETLTISSIPDIESYFIRSTIAGEQARISNSNLVVPQNEALVFMDEIFITSVNTLNDNNLEVSWCWNEDADLNSSRITYTSLIESNFLNVALSNPLTSSVEENIAFIAGVPDIYTFQVESTDVCDGIFTSQEISSILLQISTVSEAEIRVGWNPYEYADARLDSYQLFESNNGNDILIYEGSATEQILPRVENSGETCYFVVANATGNLLDGTEKQTQITSNFACSAGLPIIRMPNAFNPYGRNSIFRPLFGNTNSITTYKMSIFNRWGELLFQTNTFDEGWNGRSGLKEMPQGVYSYLLEVEVQSGEQITRQGNVLLLR